jgi:hypothetical protein
MPQRSDSLAVKSDATLSASSPSLSLLSLAVFRGDCAAQPMTRVRRIAGNDRRGKYEITWLQLTERFANPVVRARVNADPEKEARSHLCPPNAGEHLDVSFEMKVTYLSPRLFGISTGEDSFCGGAHPVHGTRGLLYDLRTGTRLDVEREMVNAGAFRRFVDRRVRAARPSDAPECADAYDHGEGYIYILRERTLSVTQDFPNVIMACAYTTEIPHADLIPFLKPNSPLRTLVARR